jgi:hypothetical protein
MFRKRLLQWLGVAVVAALALGATPAHAQGHSYINYMRSSTQTAVFVQQSVDGEYGRFTATGNHKAEDGTETPYTEAQFWKGYGIGTTVGIEMIKFIQVVAGHTFVNLRYKDDALESLNGSRLNAGLRLVFMSPVANLEAGGGLQGSRLDYQKQLENASFYGSGTYYSLGLNYFLSTRVSVYYEAKLEQEHMVRNGGSSVVEAIDTESTLMGLGFRIWL